MSCCFTSTNNWLLHSHVLMLLIHSYATVTEVIRRMTAVTLASYPRQSVSASDHCQTQKTEQERNRTTLAENSLKLPSLGDIFKKWAIFTATLSVKWTRNFLTIKLSVGTTCCRVRWRTGTWKYRTHRNKKYFISLPNREKHFQLIILLV